MNVNCRFLPKKTQIKIRFFCLTSHFWWCANHIAVHLLQLSFWWCFAQLLFETFLIIVIKKYLICRKWSFPHLFNIFFRKYHHTLSSCCQHPSNPKANKVDIFQSQYFQMLFNVIADRHNIKYKFLILNQNTVLVLKISYYLLNLSLRLLQICFYSFTDFRGRVPMKLLFAINKCKTFTCIHRFGDSLICHLLYWLKIHTHPFSWYVKVLSRSTSWPGPIPNTSLYNNQHSVVIFTLKHGWFCDVAFRWEF